MEADAGTSIKPEDISEDIGTEVFADEAINFDDSDNKVWLIKIPKFLKERWESVDEDALELGTLRVYNDNTVKVLLPPQETDNLTRDLPREYTLNVHKHASENNYIFGEREAEVTQEQSQLAASGAFSRVNNPIHTRLSGRIHHEGALIPDLNDSYKSIMKQRHASASQPKRTAKVLETEDTKLQHGFNTASRFSSFVKTDKGKKAGGQFERAARMPKNELLDLLFSLFERNKYWNMRDLRARTQQPLTYLKETLMGIAHLATKGPYHGHWYLQDVYQREHHDKVKQQADFERQARENDDDEMLDDNNDSNA
ncbi:hypothetical protein E3P99_02332 [Wallemia hederae]|uniref:Transcription initiation factor IIF subunit beta n=1 Tax=Wallemia hederae TaxID=1540922 RepID=A0A4T0FK56_9BASI|nr:hypothetical protein E3P99_02332 [Wallemia hederae]